ncbi:MAG: diguanylate cyclase, partial [Syntrophomonadaceae bacterium]|nr:diguanylate cyclase [Syntrophomonadaceae bacterium]
QNYKKLLNLSGKIVSISDKQQWHLKHIESSLKDILDHAGQGFLTFGEDLRVNKLYSAECANIFNTPIENANILELLFQDSQDEQHLKFAKVFSEVFQADDDNTRFLSLYQLPKRIQINNKHINIEYKIIKQFQQENEKDAVMLILSDISEKYAAEKQILFLSYHDKLTGLFNRAYIDSILLELDNEQQLPISLIMADMNGLKLSNDIFGHAVGDQLLINIARVFNECCRQSDIIARWGGDEFVILLPGTNQAACEAICKRIKATCRKFALDPIELSVSLGTATRNNLKDDMMDCFRQAESAMYENKLLESKDNRQRIIMNLEKKLWQIEHESEDHCGRIADMSERLADLLHLAPNEKINLRRLAYLHDIGKVTVPMEILNKPASLNPEEWKTMQKHSDAGYRMAMAINEPQLAKAILYHHEHYNGCGYPQGLIGEEIPLMARILGVVDAYEAMTNDRPYRSAISSELAAVELEKGSGTQFDPLIVDLFINMMNISSEQQQLF